MANIFNATTTTGLQLTPDNSGAIQLQTNNGTTAMTISTAQAVTTTNAINMGSSFLRNRIINGNMAIDQRNAGAVTSSQGYCVDRWAFGLTSGTLTAQQTGTIGNNSLTITATSSVSLLNVYQRIEAANIADLAGTTVTVSFIASSNAITSLIVGVGYANSLNNFTTATSIATNTISITSTPTLYSMQFTLPSSAANGIYLSVANGMTLANGNTLVFSNVQLEAGSVATPFERRQIGTELALCQRYYYKLKAATAYANAGVGRAYSTTNAQAMIGLPVSMRTGPTGSYSALSDWNDSGGGTPSAIDPVSQYSSDCRWMTVNLTGTYTSGQSIALNANNTTNAYIAWSAEL
jgi:hypothetical protein